MGGCAGKSDSEGRQKDSVISANQKETKGPVGMGSPDEAFVMCSKSCLACMSDPAVGWEILRHFSELEVTTKPSSP